MINYTLNDDQIFYVKFTGDVNYQEIAEYLKRFESLEHLPADLRLIYDFSEANLTVDPDDIQKISSMADAVTTKYKSVRTAFLVTKPMETAFTMLFIQEKSEMDKKRKVFTTREVAEEWLFKS